MRIVMDMARHNENNSIGYPCSCGGALVARGSDGQEIDLDREGASLWVCSLGCGVRFDARAGDDRERARCPADGAPLTFDPTIVGMTVGGLRLRGWLRCDHCGTAWITRRGVPDAGGGSDGRWRVAAGGRSLDAGGLRLRVDGKGAKDDVVTLMARIARMPAFEAALERIASGELDAAAAAELAREALAVGDTVEVDA